MKKIKILHVLGSLDIGGAESRLMDILRRIDNKRFQFDFVVHSKKNYFEKEAQNLGAKIFKVNRFMIINYLSYKKTWEKILKNSNYDIIHGHSIVAGFIYFKIAKKNHINIRIAHSRSGSKNGFLRGKLIDYSIRQANQYLSVSKLSGEIYFGDANEFIVLNNPFDFNKFWFNSVRRKIVRDKYGIEESQIVYGHVGRFHVVKNHIFLLKIFKNLTEIDDSFLMLVGRGKETKSFFDLAKKFNLEDKIIHVEQSDHVEDFLSAMDIFIFPSWHEGLPGSVLEAQISGLPVVVSNTISREVLLTEKSYALDLNLSPNEWSNFILNIQKNNVDSRKNASINKKINLYDVKHVIKEYQDYYLNLIGQISKNE